jgi:small conductance mechanosensitive channel
MGHVVSTTRLPSCDALSASRIVKSSALSVVAISSHPVGGAFMPTLDIIIFLTPAKLQLSATYCTTVMMHLHSLSFCYKSKIFKRSFTSSNVSSNLCRSLIRSSCALFSSQPATPQSGEKQETPPKSLSQRLVSIISIAPRLNNIIIKSKITDDTDLANFLSKTAAITIYSFLGVTTLGTFGIDTSAIIAGFGVTGFAIGFALKEILTNFLSGIFLIFQRPFTKGAYIKIHGSGGGIEGLVEAIDIRYVHLKAEGNKGVVKIPSAIVYSNPITVQTAIESLNGQNATVTKIQPANTDGKMTASSS